MEQIWAIFLHYQEWFDEHLQKTTSTLFTNIPILISLLTIILFSIYIYFKLIGAQELNLPPSPPRLPVIGNLHQLGSNLHRSLRSLSAKYGQIMTVHFCNVPTLIVSCDEVAREILNGQAFQNRPQIKLAEALFFGCTDVAFCAYGEYWREMKKICTLELFSLKRVRACRGVREEEVSEAIEKVRRCCGASIDLSEMFIDIANNIVSRSALGGKYARGDHGGESFGDLSRKAMGLIGEFNFKDFIPYLGWIDALTGFDSRVKETVKAFHDLLDQVIEEHEKRNGTSQLQSDEKDLVDVFLNLQKSGQLSINFTRENLIATLLDMFIGGTDNNASTMEWAMAELVKNPSLMEKVQEEIRRVVGKKAKIEESDIDQMMFLKCVIKETFRLHVPMMITRESTISTKLQGYDIPPKTSVMINAWAIQRDPKLWERAEEFVPERFENSAVDLKGQHSHFIPFGSGRRGCPGILFTMAEIECVLANLLYWFDWKLPNGQAVEDLDMSEVFGLVIRRKVPLRLVPVIHSFSS